MLGYDIIYVDDIAATRNGIAAYENTRFTANYTSQLSGHIGMIVLTDIPDFLASTTTLLKAFE